ncbi:MAG: MBL fold metallo-hydrolase [Bacteroidales bacterium]|jgi:L-ascorbate metabolism protein UlaG (beta-lactamase superfamily)|nr:MBL fold metallo-hydrolase [Bacteroidales bacterium]
MKNIIEKEMNLLKKKKRYRMLWIIVSVAALIAVSVIIFLNQPKFGRAPGGERMERIKNSPNYRNGEFQNLSETRQITSDKGLFGSMFDFLFKKVDNLKPDSDLPAIKTDLWQLDRNKDLLIWFGHSSCLIQIDGKRIMVDPVFCDASPVSFVNKPFKGTNIYRPEDIPEIDYLVISHDHWDHLDYKTVMDIKDRTGKIICGLGVGEHFEHWGFDKNKIVELDWNENIVFDDGFTVYCLPARHFSGRKIFSNNTLWASYLFKTPSQNIYIGGDSGYDTHFADIGKRFTDIDLAILENGQYDKDWRYIHLLPEYVVQAFKDLKAKKLLTVHNSKYALGKHSWKAPLENISEAAEKDSLNLMIPMIGEIIYLNDSSHKFEKWWTNIN